MQFAKRTLRYTYQVGLSLAWGRNRMLSITKKALEAIGASVKDKGENPHVRVYVAGFG